MEEILAEFLAGITIGEVQQYQQLAIFPLLASREAREDFLLLDEALNLGVLRITELHEAGTVPLLRVVNQSPHKVLIIDGEELVGAKQNRVVNTTILLAPNSEMAVPVSCVEAGRWSYRTREFSSSGRSLNVQLRQRKTAAVLANLRRSGLFQANQDEIWEEIEAKMARLGVPSPTMAFSTLYDATGPSLTDYRRHFRPVAGQVGLAAFLGGSLAGVEVLNKYDKFAGFFPKLLDSYILDAVELATAPPPAPPAPAVVQEFLAAATQCPVERRPSVSLGEDWRLAGKGVIGAALVLDGDFLYLSLFPDESAGVNSSRKTRSTTLRRASRRRNLL